MLRAKKSNIKGKTAINSVVTNLGFHFWQVKFNTFLTLDEHPQRIFLYFVRILINAVQKWLFLVFGENFRDLY